MAEANFIYNDCVMYDFIGPSCPPPPPPPPYGVLTEIIEDLDSMCLIFRHLPVALNDKASDLQFVCASCLTAPEL